MSADAYPGLPPSYRGPAVQHWTSERAAVIGDVHGRTALLDLLLPHLGGRDLFFLGDLCDRGPDSKGALQRVVDHGGRTVLGNHDLWLAGLAAGDGLDESVFWPSMGAGPTLISYGIDAYRPDPSRIPAAHRDLLLDAPVAARLSCAGQDWWLTHSGVPLTVPWPAAVDEVVPTLAQEASTDFIWHFEQPEQQLPVDVPVVMGHRPRREPIDLGHLVAIDTGAGRRGYDRLTALLLPERRFVTVPG
ncbi:MAG: hypothetical protein EP330_01370 [Deltaproteobacteria bacterium]|nr:MAG: hypothetical protein EP330_01370 [Deltaproteobacteria bacterium]